MNGEEEAAKWEAWVEVVERVAVERGRSGEGTADADAGADAEADALPLLRDEGQCGREATRHQAAAPTTPATLDGQRRLVVDCSGDFYGLLCS